MAELSEEELQDGYRAAWALFRACELEDLATATEISRTWAGPALEQGLTLVCAVLRKTLLEHAEQVGCDCGSKAWIEAAVLRAAQVGRG